MADFLPGLDLGHLPNVAIASGLAIMLGALGLQAYPLSIIGGGIALTGFGEAICRHKRQFLVRDDLGRLVGTGHTHAWRPRFWGLAFDAVGIGTIVTGLWRLLFG